MSANFVFTHADATVTADGSSWAGMTTLLAVRAGTMFARLNRVESS